MISWHGYCKSDATFCNYCVANVHAVHLHVPSRFKKELKKRKLADDDYVEGPGGLRISELSGGSGAVVNTGDVVTVRDHNHVRLTSACRSYANPNPSRISLLLADLQYCGGGDHACGQATLQQHLQNTSW